MEEVLVVPRKTVSSAAKFTHTKHAARLLRNMAFHFTWMERAEAETALDWVQVIPCAIIANPSGWYSVFERISDTAEYMSSKLSLIIGGHIDKSELAGGLDVHCVDTLFQELDEEAGITKVLELKELGIAFDQASTAVSRHIARVYRVTVDHPVIPRASEEFVLKSKHAGLWYSRKALEYKHPELDPWSSIINYNYIQGENHG